MLLQMWNVVVVDLEIPSESGWLSQTMRSKRHRLDYERVAEMRIFGNLSMDRVPVAINTAISGMNMFG
jgi:hypothetical protein